MMTASSRCALSSTVNASSGRFASWWTGSRYTSLAKKINQARKRAWFVKILFDLLLGAAAENQKRGQTRKAHRHGGRLGNGGRGIGLKPDFRLGAAPAICTSQVASQCFG